MTRLARHAPVLAVTVAVPVAEAGQQLPISLDVRVEGSAQVMAGEVELVRSSVVTHSVRNWTGAGYRVGIRSSTVCARREVDFAGQLSSGDHEARQVTLFVPADEVTVSGHLVQRDYLVRARVWTGDGGAAEGTAQVYVAGPASPQPRTVDVPALLTSADFATLAFDEPSARRLCAGVPLRGVVTLAPRRAGRIRGVRVELVLAEHVRARPGEPLEEDCDAMTVIGSVRTAAEVDLRPGEDARVPFQLTVPDRLPAPSTGTTEYTIRWLLRAVIDRPLHPDTSTTIELLARATRC